MRSPLPSKSQSRIIWFAITALAVAAIIAVSAGLFWSIGKFLDLFSPVLWPLAIAAVLAYLLDPAVIWLERKISRTWAIVVVFIAAILIFGGILGCVIPRVLSETNRLVLNIPHYKQKVSQQLDKWAGMAAGDSQGQDDTNAPTATNAAPTNVPDNTNFPSDTNSLVASASTNSPAISPTNSAAAGNLHQQILTSTKSWLGQIAPKAVNWLLNLLSKVTVLMDVAVALVLIPIYTFYFLRDKDGIQSHWTNYLPVRDSRLKDELVFILTAVNQYMIAFFRGQVIVALISGVLYTVGFLIIGLDYAFLLGLIAVFLVIVPFIGAIVLLLLGILFTGLQFHDLYHPLMVVGLFTVVQSLESFFYSPRIMGDRVNLHPVVVIIALMAGVTLLGGLLGGILAIPLAAALRVLLFRYVWKKSEP
jgi:predicted PurR-regulated permease PerM